MSLPAYRQAWPPTGSIIHPILYPAVAYFGSENYKKPRQKQGFLNHSVEAVFRFLKMFSVLEIYRNSIFLDIPFLKNLFGYFFA